MEESLKINFFKKIWYSIAKPSKYEDLRKLGVGKAIKYIFLIISILALVLAIFATVVQLNVVNDAISYLDENLPEIKFKDNKLTLENEEAVILDDNKIVNYFGNKIVINPLIGKQEAINQYKDLTTENNKVIIFLNDEYVVISNEYNSDSEKEEGIETKKYVDVSKNFIKDASYEYGKKDVIEYLKERTSYSYYMAKYFVVYIISIMVLYCIYILLISFGLWSVAKASKLVKKSDNKLSKIIITILLLICTVCLILKGYSYAIYLFAAYIGLLICKNEWSFKESLMNTIYASTLSLLVYVIYILISYFAKIKISFIDIISIVIIFTYLYLVIWKQKKKENSQAI